MPTIFCKFIFGHNPYFAENGLKWDFNSVGIHAHLNQTGEDFILTGKSTPLCLISRAVSHFCHFGQSYHLQLSLEDESKETLGKWMERIDVLVAAQVFNFMLNTCSLLNFEVHFVAYFQIYSHVHFVMFLAKGRQIGVLLRLHLSERHVLASQILEGVINKCLCVKG